MSAPGFASRGLGGQEAMRRVFWRFGLVFAAGGAALAAQGLLLLASFHHWIAWTPYRIYSLVTPVFGALAVVGAAWQLTACYRDGFFFDKKYAEFFLPYAGLPIAIIGAYALLGLRHSIPEDTGTIAAGVGLVLSGVWAMRAKLPPPNEL